MRVLVTEPIHEQGLSLLKQHFTVIEGNTKDENNLCGLIADCQGVLIRTAKITRRVIEAAPGLMCIAKHGVGVDNVDLAAATQRKIKVVNAPFSNCNAVAEHALAFMMALLRRIPQADAKIRNGNYVASRATTILGELTGKTVGFIGFGRIPQRITELLRPFRSHVMAYDPYADASAFSACNALRCGTLQELLAAVDIVSIHVPLSADTKNLLRAETIACMKQGALLVDTARGGIVDEEAVVAALESGHLGGAAFDVFAQEPPLASNPLLACEKTILSPHSAALTAEALVNMAVQSAENLTAVLLGKEPSSCVNIRELAAQKAS